MITLFDSTWHALAREAALGTRLIATGLGAIRRAHPANNGTYYEGFFGLTIGLERVLKLTIAVSDFVAVGEFPTDEYFRQTYSHDLDKLVTEVESRVSSGRLSPRHRLQMTAELTDLVSFLTGFAKKTRYYNLGYLGQASTTADEPIQSWTRLVLKHYPQPAHRGRGLAGALLAAELDAVLGRSAMIRRLDEAGNLVDSFAGMAEASARTEHVQRKGTMMCIHLARPVESALASLSYSKTTNQDQLPVFSDFTVMLSNPDSYLRTRKTFHYPQ